MNPDFLIILLQKFSQDIFYNPQNYYLFYQDHNFI